MSLMFHCWQQAELLGLAQATDGRLGVSVELGAGFGGSSKFGHVQFRFPAAWEIARIRPEAIRHLAPQPFTADAEATKLVHVDFHDPELPWRYTSAPNVDQDKLRPWIVLLVEESSKMTIAADRVTVAEEALSRYRLVESHRWAHVQLGGNAPISRLLSRSLLLPFCSYNAAIVPTYAPGGRDMWNIDGKIGIDGQNWLPNLFSWSFQTGEEGDFDTLAAALRPHIDDTLGRATLHYFRDVDGAARSLTIKGAMAAATTLPVDVETANKIRGDLDQFNDEVLEAPEMVPSGFELRDAIGLPAYARPWIAEPDAVAWAKSLDDDPRYRAIAGIGTWMGVLAQQRLMDAAVRQAGALHAATDMVGWLAAGLSASRYLWRAVPAKSADQLALLGPALGAIAASDGRQVLRAATDEQSMLEAGLFSSALKRQLGRSRLRHMADQPKAGSLISTANVAPTPLSKEPDGLPHIDRALPGGMLPYGRGLGLPEYDADRLERLFAEFEGHLVDVASIRRFWSTAEELLGPLACRPLDRRREATDELSRRLRSAGTDEILLFDRALMKHAIGRCAVPGSAGDDPRAGLDLAIRWPPRPEKRRVTDLDALAAAVRAVLDPWQPVPPAMARVGSRIAGVDLMDLAAPEAPIDLDFATWLLLLDHAKEWLLPGAGLVPANRVTVLETNPAFVEAYLVGLSAQFLAEMRWRGLSASRLGTPLCSFWSQLDPQSGKRVPDILPVSLWPSMPPGTPGADDVGSRDHQYARAGDEGGREDLVVAVRSAIFRRYPSTLIYLVKRPPAGVDLEEHLNLAPDFNAQPDSSGDRIWVPPLFTGRLEPDFHFFIFDLDPEKRSSYHIVLVEPPTELRFRNDKEPAGNAAEFAATAIDKQTRVAIDWDYFEKLAP